MAAVVLTPRPPGAWSGDGGFYLPQNEASEPQATPTQESLAFEAGPGTGMQQEEGLGWETGGQGR